LATKIYDLESKIFPLVTNWLPNEKNNFKPRGNVVNVPADVNSTVNILPRLPQESGTIKVELKRRLQYKASAQSLNARPYKNFTNSKLTG